ncbi:MAG: hypothetical protein ACOX2L_08760 [Anaerolineae bacterium]|jgi:hypothetical protein|nr:hypothetical protein [Chloroflexota bacterium]
MTGGGVTTVAQLAGLALSALLTLAVLSYLWGDNPVYRASQYLMAGLTAGYAAALAWNHVLAPRLRALITEPAEFWPYGLMLLLCGLLLARGWPPLQRLSGLPLALMLGVGAALAVGGAIRGTLLPQMGAMIVSLSPARHAPGITGLAQALDAGFMLLVTLTVLWVYRYRAPSEGGSPLPRALVRGIDRTGRLLMLVVVAASLAGAALSYFAALRGRVDFMLDWLGSLMGWGG